MNLSSRRNCLQRKRERDGDGRCCRCERNGDVEWVNWLVEHCQEISLRTCFNKTKSTTGDSATQRYENINSVNIHGHVLGLVAFRETESCPVRKDNLCDRYWYLTLDLFSNNANEDRVLSSGFLTSEITNVWKWGQLGKKNHKKWFRVLVLNIAPCIGLIALLYGIHYEEHYDVDLTLSWYIYF